MIERVVLFFIQIELFLIHKLFPKKTAFSVTRGLMRMFYIIIPRKIKGDIEDSLRLIYGYDEHKIRKIRSKYIKKMLGYFGEIIALNYVDKKYMDKNVSFHCFELATKSLKEGNGVILLFIHAGNWELLARSLILRGLDTNMIVKVPEKSALMKFIDTNRVQLGGKSTNVLKDNMFAEAMKSLKDNKPVVMLADTGALDSKHHEYVDFMGMNVPLATGWVTLARKSGAKVIPITIHNDRGKHEIEFIRAIDGNKDNILEIVKNDFENFIRKHPMEWFLPLDSHQVKKSFKEK